LKDPFGFTCIEIPNRNCRFSSHGTGFKPIAIFGPINRFETISINQLDTPTGDALNDAPGILSNPRSPCSSRHVRAIPCGLQGGGALGDASTRGTPARPMAASAHGGTYSHVAVAGSARGGERGAAAATTAAAARRRRATPTRGAVTLPRSAPAHGGRGGRHCARAGGWDRPLRDGAPSTAPLDGVSKCRRAAATEAGAQARSPAGHRARVKPRMSLRAVAVRNSGRWGGRGGRRCSGPVTPGQSFSATYLHSLLASTRP